MILIKQLFENIYVVKTLSYKNNFTIYIDVSTLY